jgi:Uncharacterized protein conserved in bacteria (DUF2330)
VMPVDQRGENILFVRDGEDIEAHIQIQYEGEAQAFAWIVPMMAVPEISVGSEPLFQALLTATVPTFTIAQRTDGDCGGGDEAIGCAAARSDSLAAGGEADDWMDEDQPGPQVVIKGTAGAFEYAVLDGGTTEGVVRWLEDNGYANDPEAAPILESYLQAGFVFVAFKLRGGAGVDEIHPVVLRYRGSEPCVPIRLTQIAATDDMGIRVFFLGEHRVAPTNYRHVVINPIQIDWAGLAANYDAVVTMAVDGDEAAGHAFVTEYAGPSNVVPAASIDLPGLDGSKFVGLRANEVIDELERQRLLTCESEFEAQGPCQALHPLVGPLLEEFFPTPAWATPEQWWEDLDGSEELDTTDWPVQEFAARFEERIAAPAEHAGDLLYTHGYLTRMYTTMSPAEMTEDPTFHENAQLPAVSNQFSATIVSDCDGPKQVELGDGRVIRYDEDGLPPVFEDMPYALAVQEVPPTGAPMTLLDHAAAIDDELDAWNDAQDGGCACRMAPLRSDGLMLFGLVVLGARARRRRA